MLESNKDDKPYSDADVFRKLTNGLPLTEFDLNLITDAYSIQNLIKLLEDNLKMNAELNEYFKEKREEKIALIAEILFGITEYMTWKQTQETQAYQAKTQEIAKENFDLDDKVNIDISLEAGWATKLIENVFPPEHHHPYHQEIQSHIEEESKQATRQEIRDIQAVLALAAHSEKIRKFLFPEKNTTHGMMDRIHFVAATMREVHSHKFMSNPKLITEIKLAIEAKKEISIAKEKQASTFTEEEPTPRSTKSK